MSRGDEQSADVPPQPDIPASAPGESSPAKAYELMASTPTYALGVAALQEACSADVSSPHPLIEIAGSSVYRPLAFRENIEARVKEYNTLTNPDGSSKTEEQRLPVFNKWLDSCMGIAYQRKTTKFKLIPHCEQLITIADDFNEAFIAAPYDALHGVELDSRARSVKYNDWLTQNQVVNHPAWKAAVDDDALLREYAGIIFPLLHLKYQRDTGMGFFVIQNPAEDQLRALFVINLYNSSNAYGFNNLSSGGSFLRVAPSSSSSPPEGRAPKSGVTRARHATK